MWVHYSIKTKIEDLNTKYLCNCIIVKCLVFVHAIYKMFHLALFCFTFYVGIYLDCSFCNNPLTLLHFTHSQNYLLFGMFTGLIEINKTLKRILIGRIKLLRTSSRPPKRLVLLINFACVLSFQNNFSCFPRLVIKLRLIVSSSTFSPSYIWL